MDANETTDKYTLAWWRTQFRGVQHSLNRCNADYADLTEIAHGLRDRVKLLEAEAEEMRAEIGRLQDTIDRAREAYRELKGNGS